MQGAKLLDEPQQTSLEVLAFLFLRMNLWDSAERAYKALLALQPKDLPHPSAHLALASIAIENKNGKEALAHLDMASEHIPRNSKYAPYYLLRAKALELEQRFTEAKQAADEYLYYNSAKS